MRRTIGRWQLDSKKTQVGNSVSVRMDGMISPRVTDRKGAKAEVPEYMKADNQGNTPENVELFNSAVAGSVHRVRTAIAKGGKVNYFHRPEDQKNALHIASECGHKGVVSLLLDNEAVVDSRVGSTKDTALILACQHGQVDIAEMLLGKGADVNLTNCYGNSALHESARHGDTDLTRLLISEGSIVNTSNNKGSTPLHMFSYSDAKTTAVASILLDAGAAIDARDARGMTPMLAAVMSGKIDYVLFFEDEGADMTAIDAEGYDALAIAKFNKHETLVKMFSSKSTGSK